MEEWLEKITQQDKINSIEYFTRTHYAAYQFVDCGLVEYFAMLRRGENDEFLDKLHTYADLMEYSYVVRDTHQEYINRK